MTPTLQPAQPVTPARPIADSDVETIELRPGYRISRLIKGGWQLAGGHGPFDPERAVTDMLRFVEAGVTTFDCADIYTGVEALIGQALTTLRQTQGEAAAGQVQVHTKLVPDLQNLPTLTRREVRAIVDRSLQRLQIDCLHMVQFYWWDLSLGEPLEVLAELKTLREEGRIRHLGVTNWSETEMTPFVQAGFAPVSAQVQYSLLDARPADTYSQWCADHDIQILCYGVLAGGFIGQAWLGQPDPGFEFDNRSLVKYRLIIEEFGGWALFQALLEALQNVAERHDSDISAVAMRYMLDQPHVAAVIIGARTADHLGATLATFDLSLDAADRLLIDRILNQRQGPVGAVYALERDRGGPHGRIMKYNLNAG